MKKELAVVTNRRKRLAEWINIKFDGKQAAFVEKTGVNQGELSLLLKTKSFGEKKARSLEVLAEMPSGWLDIIHAEDMASLTTSVRAYQQPQPNAEWLGGFDVWDNSTPLQEDEVALPFYREVRLSAGAGSTEVQENHCYKLRFAKSTLKRQGVQIEHAYCVTVRGNSMDPVLPDGCTVGVDTGSTNVVNGDWYALDHHGELRVKVLYRLHGGGYRLRSFNSDEYPDEYPVLEQDVRILGRVFWWSGLR